MCGLEGESFKTVEASVGHRWRIVCAPFNPKPKPWTLNEGIPYACAGVPFLPFSFDVDYDED
jgi:hypothetical protein